MSIEGGLTIDDGVRAMGVPKHALNPHGVLIRLDRPAYKAMYYGLLESLVVRQLMLGQSAIVDALITDQIATHWRQLATEHGAQLHVVHCVCSNEAEHRRRIEGRHRGIPGWHGVGWDHVLRMRAEFPPPTVAHLSLDAMNPLQANLAAVRGELGW